MGSRQETPPRSARTATALSALVEGFGQAYNRQPAKAVAYLVAGLTLSTASGLNTWLIRNVLGLKGTRVGPERIRPALLALWAATFVANLADAWHTAQDTNRRAVLELEAGAATPIEQRGRV